MESLGITATTYECLIGLSPGRTIRTALGILADPTVPTGTHVDLLGRFLESNQAYENLIQKIDAVQRMNSDWTGLDTSATGDTHDGAIRTLRILGPTGARNALICLGMQCSVGAGIPKKEGDPLLLDIRGRLKYSLAIEELWQENSWTFPYQAFLGGLHFDWLALCVEKNKKIPSATKGYLDEIWRSSLKTCRIAQLLSSMFPDFKFQQSCVPAALLLGIGRILMSVNFPAGAGPSVWLDFQKELAKQNSGKSKVNPVQKALRERHRFSVTHNELAALVAGFCGLFTPISMALLYASEPYLLKGVDSDLYMLAVILSSAEELQARDPSDASSLPLETRKRLAEFGLMEDVVLKQINKGLRT